MVEPEAGKTESNSNKTDKGIQQNVAGLLCYVLGWITGIIFLIIEKDNKFVKFHAVQSIVVFGAFTIVTPIFGWIPNLGTIVDSILGLAAFALWIVLMLKAYQGQMFKLPISGNIAEKLTK
jgi:uncharacterized membrane protein